MGEKAGQGFHSAPVAATLACGSDRMIRRAQEAAAPAKALKSKAPTVGAVEACKLWGTLEAPVGRPSAYPDIVESQAPERDFWERRSFAFAAFNEVGR